MNKFKVLLFLGLVGPLLVSCAPTFTGKVGQMSISVAGVRKMAKEVLDERCMETTKQCPKVGAGEEITCEAWLKCRDLRRGVYKAATTIQIALDTAVMLSGAGDQDAADKWYNKAVKAFFKLKEDLIKYKVLDLEV